MSNTASCRCRETGDCGWRASRLPANCICRVMSSVVTLELQHVCMSILNLPLFLLLCCDFKCFAGLCFAVLCSALRCAAVAY